MRLKIGISGKGFDMEKILIVIDMQNDFVTGTLGTKEAQAIVPAVKAKIEKAKADGVRVVYTRDTHSPEYRFTQEGRNLPVEHCIRDTDGWQIVGALDVGDDKIFDKPAFGSVALANFVSENMCAEAELIGLCTDICVISNALLLKAYLPEMKITVDAACCAGVTPESHKNALEAMKMCQIKIVND